MTLMKAKCVIVDDEPLAVNVIQNHIEKLDSLDIIATCNRASEAFNVLKSKKVDLLFLDIKMPGISGIDFLKSLSHPPKVILTTAYRDYAIEGYELDIVDYLLKPISFDRFLKAVNKFLDINALTKITLHESVDIVKLEGFIYVKANKRVHKVKLKDIVYIESLKDYIKICAGPKDIVSKYALSSFEETLLPEYFIRIHRSFIVGLEHITGFTTTSIEIGEKELPIGKMYRQQVFAALNYHNPTE